MPCSLLTCLAHHQALSIDNLLCQLRLSRHCCHFPPSGLAQWFSLSAAMKTLLGWDHPSAPAPALGPDHRMFHQDWEPLPSGRHMQPRRQGPPPKAMGTPLGILQSVTWKNPPKKPVPSAPNSMMCGHLRTIPIPPPGHIFSLLRSPPGQVSQGYETRTIQSYSLSFPKEMKGEVPEEPPKNQENHTETNKDSIRTAPLAVWIYYRHLGPWRPMASPVPISSPGPLDLHPKHPQDSLSGDAPLSPRGSSSKGQGVTAHKALGEVSCLL